MTDKRKAIGFTAQSLQDRLIEFACTVLKICEVLPRNVAGKTLGNQLGRSGTSPALVYSEARAAESSRDFIHKMRVSLKELRESHTCHRIITRMDYVPRDLGIPAESEANELVAIFVSSIRTKERNSNHKS